MIDAADLRQRLNAPLRQLNELWEVRSNIIVFTDEDYDAALASGEAAYPHIVGKNFIIVRNTLTDFLNTPSDPSRSATYLMERLSLASNTIVAALHMGLPLPPFQENNLFIPSIAVLRSVLIWLKYVLSAQ